MTGRFWRRNPAEGAEVSESRSIAAGGDAQASKKRSGGRVIPGLGGGESEKRQRFPVPYAVPVALSTWVVLAAEWASAWKWGMLP